MLTDATTVAVTVSSPSAAPGREDEFLRCAKAEELKASAISRAMLMYLEECMFAVAHLPRTIISSATAVAVLSAQRGF